MEHPSATDICCGRGKGRWNSPGNRKFKELVIEHLDKYANAPSKTEKSKVVESVVEAVEKMGSRFVKLDEANGKWFEIKATEKRSKVAHAIRDHLATCRKNSLKGDQPSRKSRKVKAHLKSSASSVSNKKPRRNCEAKQSMSTESQITQTFDLGASASGLLFPQVSAYPFPSTEYNETQVQQLQDSGLSSEPFSNAMVAPLLRQMNGHSWHGTDPAMRMDQTETPPAYQQSDATSTIPWAQQLQYQQGLQLPGVQTANFSNRPILPPLTGQAHIWQSANTAAAHQSISYPGASMLLSQGPMSHLAIQGGTACEAQSNSLSAQQDFIADLQTSRGASSVPQANDAAILPRSAPFVADKESWDFIEESLSSSGQGGGDDIEPHSVFPP